MKKQREISSLAGQPLRSKRKGLVYCFRTSCISGMRKYVNQRNRSHASHGNNFCPAGQHTLNHHQYRHKQLDFYNYPLDQTSNCSVVPWGAEHVINCTDIFPHSTCTTRSEAKGWPARLEISRGVEILSQLLDILT